MFLRTIGPSNTNDPSIWLPFNYCGGFLVIYSTIINYFGLINKNRITSEIINEKFEDSYFTIYEYDLVTLP